MLEIFIWYETWCRSSNEELRRIGQRNNCRMIRRTFLLIGMCVAVSCCAANLDDEWLATTNKSCIQLCLESQVTLKNPLIERESLQISDQIRRVSITENTAVSLKTILFTAKLPYPGSPIFFCNIDNKTGRIVSATFAVGEHRSESAIFDASDRYNGYSDDQIEIIQNRSSTTIGTIENGVIVFK